MLKTNNLLAKKIIALLIAMVSVVTAFSATQISVSAAVTNYSSFSTPSASDYAYWNGSKTVKASGTTTSEVKWMQASLNYCIKYKSLSASYLSVDGIFGANSKKTTTAFQKKYSLTQDGVFGKNTIAKMKSVLATATTSTVNKDDTVRTINGQNYVRTFYDEFEGKDLDSTKWEKCPEQYRQSNYSKWDDNLTKLDGKGHLVLSANYVEGDSALHCGAIRTRKKDYSYDLFNQKYGYFEISAKLQSKKGFWSAFWLMPDQIDRGVVGGADGTEIDIFEAFDPVNKRINHAIHWDGYGSKHKKIDYNAKSNVYDGKYHTFALDWSKDSYVFYIDGKKTYTITSKQAKICEYADYLKISLESGAWTGKPKKADMPDSISVDYVKVYQRKAYLN